MTPISFFKLEKAHIYNLTGHDPCAKNRRRETILGRVALCYNLRMIGKLTYQEIGKLMGIHHATVMHHVETAKQVMRRPKIDLELYEILTDYSK